MPYEMVENFSAGLDTRKSPLTAPGGTLTRLKNAAINPGGEIEKRRAFTRIGTNYLAGTFGLAATESTLFAFTRNTTVTPPALGIAGVGVNFQKLPNGAADLVQTDFDTFNGLMYVVCSQPVSGGATPNPHYYNAVATTGANHGYYIRTYQTKMYSVLGKNLYFCSVNDPINWSSGTGYGSINLSTQDADSENLTALEVYYNRLAILSTEAVQLWAVDPDPLQNAYVQLLRGIGSSSPRSTLQFGNGDVLFLDASGVRSMKARDASNSASVSDIGSPIDNQLVALKVQKGATYYNSAVAMLEPLLGRFWMVFPNDIFVLSYFPGPHITAWSYYDTTYQSAPGVYSTFHIDNAVSCGGRLFFRSGDDLFVYGGTDNVTYDGCGVEVRLPYLNGKKPGHNKMFEAIDMSITGTWEARVSYNFNLPDAEDVIGTFSQPTWMDGRAEMQGYSSHASLRFYNTDANPATISNIAVHYQLEEDTQ